jgi:hypothetical protein
MWNQAEFHLAVSLWWRYTWRAMLIGFVVFFVAALVSAVMVSALHRNHAGLAGTLSGFLFVVSVALAVSLFFLVRMFRDAIFRRPVDLGGQPVSLIVVQRNAAKRETGGSVLPRPLPWVRAAGLFWGVTWRSVLLGLVAQWVLRAVLSLGAAPAAHVSLSALALQLIVGQMAVVGAFWWLQAHPYGRTGISHATPAGTQARIETAAEAL